ncbi:MAG: electron transfer flavoprotein subunit beta/FixA family protein [Ruminococcaceae bacterium]|nr:electron transfer flavoprotein subunit beta/FixA family protein [Oscillospiraceae bacterium]
MKIAVLIKQVPGTTQVEIDPVTGTMKRDGVAAKLNPYDLFALEEALRLKKSHGAQVTVITMGPPQAAAVVKEAVYMGCDDGVVLSDRRFAGADVLATSRTLAGGLANLGGFDLIFCGKQTTDGDTAQVGPETAEKLGIPHVANVLEIGEIREPKVTLTADMGDTEQTLSLSMPALLTFEKDINTPRLPSIKRRYELGDAELVKMLSLDDFDERDTSLYGQNGSPTRVERIFPPEVSSERVMHTEGDLAQILADELHELKVI